MIHESWSEFLKKAPLLEEIELTFTEISDEAVANADRYCPMLKIFKCNDSGYMHDGRAFDQEIADYADDFVMAIAKAMPQLRHLELISNSMTHKGLQAILDGCPHLEFLDIRRCFFINLDGSCGKLCKERIKNLLLPHDSVKGHKFALDSSEEYRAMCGDHRAMYDAMCDDHRAMHDAMYDDGDDSDLEDYEGLSDDDINCGPYYSPFRGPFTDPILGEFSSLEEFVAVMDALDTLSSSDSDSD
ncbi:putative F-box/LRR-repeat protein 23 [Heracleum sosnowskyi]|uniref:F-box/LRR-repeat protein 23 n=1 Tax=Heracleum sosnowskyi TaxID=360622 RepID=A0AAD8HYT5_9APIA|nr:putative F-box/LRR-repeat protein 23 [Heracleum sosnowskyi]